MRDRVTISLYSVETNNPPGYKEGFLNEFANIKIRDGLVAAAKKAGRESPEFVVSILLVPDWDRDSNSYNDETYLRRKSYLFIHAKHKFEAIPDVTVEDFYCDCVMLTEHKEYLHGLKALGSNADMIKTISIVNNVDRAQHLQLDSNTVIPSFESLYNQTFGAKDQKDGINASYYDDDYVSAHNKMVYTTPNGKINKLGKLHTYLWEWCRDHRHDDSDKQADKNSIYARVFTKALHEIDYVKRYVGKNGKTRYPATLSTDVYWLTDYMVTAVNASWSKTNNLNITASLKELPSIKIGPDGIFNFTCFFNVIKKHTGDLSTHSLMLGLSDTTPRGEISRELLLENSNNELELAAVREFYYSTREHHPEHIAELANQFPNIPLGNALTQELFECNVEKLRADAEKTFSLAVTQESQSARLAPPKTTEKETYTGRRPGM